MVNVLVSAFPLECALGAPLPAPVKTSAEGTFRLKGVLASLTAVYASKPESGYSDTSFAFYGPENPPTKVTVRAGTINLGYRNRTNEGRNRCRKDLGRGDLTASAQCVGPCLEGR